MSQLDSSIPPEIRDDEFYFAIERLSRDEPLSNVLEIGSASGDGSTQAFFKGLRQNASSPTLHCLEMSAVRFAELTRRYRDVPFIRCYHCSSVGPEAFATETEIVSFYNSHSTNLNKNPLSVVIRWLRQDLEYLDRGLVPRDGIARIMQDHAITVFDMVLIDGSEFTGQAEFALVDGARIMLLDDINSFKNYGNYQHLLADERYDLIQENWQLRNGYAVFRRRQ